MSVAAIIPNRTHPSYDNHYSNWDFYLKSYIGGKDYVSEYLYTHRLEASDDFTRRQNRAYFLNYCAPITTIPSDFIFKKEPTRPHDLKLKVFRESTNGRSLSIQEFMRKVSTLSAVYGHIHILIDRPQPTEEQKEQIEKEQTTKKDSLSYLQPYATIIHPTHLVDWSIDATTQTLNWILIVEEYYEDEDWSKERETYALLKLWTRNEWIKFDAEGNELERGVHGLGEVPLITCYHKDTDEDLIGESMLKDVAEANKTIFNWCSNIDEMIARQTFSQLICPDDGTLFTEEVDEQGNSSALKKVGSATIFTFPADARHPPAFISPDTAQVKTIWDMVENHVREMFRMSGLISAKSSLIQLQQRTGKAQEFEFLDMAVFLAAKAKGLENTENKMNQLV